MMPPASGTGFSSSRCRESVAQARSVIGRDISKIDAINDGVINDAMKFPSSFVLPRAIFDPILEMKDGAPTYVTTIEP